MATYPLYYVSREDMETRIPFMEKFLWAAEHDKELYNELSKLVVKSTTGYMFRKQGYSPYFSANLNVSKEIGKYLTVSFFANNFFYSMQKIKNWQTGNEGIKSDSDAFGRKTLVDTSGKPIPLDKGPFYIMPATAAVIATYCGLKINKDAKVQNVFGEVIPGLWAAGEMTGGVHGAGYMSGSAFGKAMTFGRIAAKDIAKQK